MYASFLRISRALHLDVFEQPEENYFFSNLLMKHREKQLNAPSAVLPAMLQWRFFVGFSPVNRSPLHDGRSPG